jgi:PAS domain S-box-containing protein
MTALSNPTVSERVLVLAPSGNDAANVLLVLKSGSVYAEACEDIFDLSKEFIEGAGALLVAEEGLNTDGVDALCDALAAQPKWSDISVLIVTRASESDEGGQRLLRLFGSHGNVTLVERPLRPISLVSAVQGALRARRRQYELRGFIEEREKTLRALRETETRNRLIMENVKDFAIFAFDLEGKVTTWNPGAEQMLGYSNAEALGRSVDDFFTEEDRLRRIPDVERKMAAQKGLAPNERWHLRKGGQRFFGSGATRPLLDGNGELHGFIKVMRDITDRKTAQAALESKTRRLELLADIARNLLSADAPEEIARELFARLAYELNLDIYFNCLVGKATADLHLDSFAGVSSEQVEAISEARFAETICGAVAEQRKVWMIDQVQSSTDSKAAFLRDIGLRAYASFPLLVDESFIGTLSFGSRSRDSFSQEDVSYLHTCSNFVALAQERVLYQRDLEETVRQRTVELQTKVGELEAFSYSVSHDLRAPLRAMQGYSRVLLEDHATELPPTAREYLQRIANSAERLDRLVSDILTYSRVTRGDIQNSAINMDSLIHEVVQAYPALKSADIEIKGPLHPVFGHEGSLIQCVSNLLGNAIKFVPETRKPHILIWTEPHNDRIRVNFQDNGIGISARDQERIFRIFEKASQTNNSEGTGIGLAIVRKAVERMNGATGVQSEPGHGSRFWIELPAAG